MRHATLAVGLLGLAPLCLPAAAPHPSAGRGELARQALAVLKANCYRCHGQDGADQPGDGGTFQVQTEQLVQLDANQTAIDGQHSVGGQPVAGGGGAGDDQEPAG